MIDLPTIRCALSPFGLMVILTRATPASTAAEPPRPAPTSIGALRDLSRDELFSRGRIRVEGTVVGQEQKQGLLFLQSEGAGIVAATDPTLEPLAIGTRVAVTGMTINEPLARLRAFEVEQLEPQPSTIHPDPWRIADALATSSFNGALVQIAGLVQSVRTNWATAAPVLRRRVTMLLRDDHHVLAVVAPRPPPAVATRLRLARLRVRGVLVELNVPGVPAGPVLWMPDWDQAGLEREGPKDVFGRPLVSLAGALAGVEQSDGLPVRLRAAVLDVSSRSLLRLGDRLERPTYTLTARVNTPRLVHSGDAVEVLGYALKDDPVAKFDVTEMRWLGLPADGRTRGTSPPWEEWTPVAATAEEVVRLTEDQVRDGWPIRVVGAVTFRDEQARRIYLQKQNGVGLEVDWAATNSLPQLEDYVLVRGHARTGLRQTAMTATSMHEFDRKLKIRPLNVPVVEFKKGLHHGRRVRFTGVVRSARRAPIAPVLLRMESQGLLFRVLIHSGDTAVPSNLVDAWVAVTGVAAALLEEDGDVDEVLRLSSSAGLEVLRPAPRDVFALPAMPIADAHAQDWQQAFVHRIHLQGVVTLARPTIVYVDDGTGGIPLRTPAGHPAKTGDQVEVVGFPRRVREVTRLDDVIIRVKEPEELPAASAISAPVALRGESEGRRVRLVGTVVGHSLADGAGLEIRDAGIVFSADLPSIAAPELVERWPLGCIIEATGVCVRQDEGPFAAGSFRVYVDHERDLVVLRPPPWWTPERMRLASVIGVLLLVALGGWAAFLHGRARRDRDQFRAAFDSNPLPTWIVRCSDGSCLAVNAAFERLIGWKLSDLTGLDLRRLQDWAGDGATPSLMPPTAGRGPKIPRETTLRTRDGRELTVLLSIDPMRYLGEEAMLCSAFDVTERLRLMAQLQQSQKMEAVGQLAAGVAHDFNNLLTVMQANSSLINMGAGLSPDTRVLATEIEDASKRAADLTQQLLAYSRKSVLQFSTVDLNTVVQSACRMLGRIIGETILLECRPHPEPLAVSVDAGMINQVVMNLGVNARDAMPQGGKLSVTTRISEYEAEAPPTHPDGQVGRFAVIEAVDTGEGMPPDVRDRVFEPFFTTKEVGKGTGLGLSTVYGIVRQHGGWIEVESRPGAGTRFTVYLPILGNEDLDADGATESTDTARGHETILVVEDDESVRTSILRTLERHGYKALAATDGPAAEDCWRQHAAEVDLLLTDLVMPHGISGFELARRMHQQRPDLKVVYMTGYSPDLGKDGEDLLPGADLLSKPFAHDQLLRTLRRQLESPPASRPQPRTRAT